MSFYFMSHYLVQCAKMCWPKEGPEGWICSQFCCLLNALHLIHSHKLPSMTPERSWCLVSESSNISACHLTNSLNIYNLGVPAVVQWDSSSSSHYGGVGSIPSPPQWVKGSGVLAWIQWLLCMQPLVWGGYKYVSISKSMVNFLTNLYLLPYFSL